MVRHASLRRRRPRLIHSSGSPAPGRARPAPCGLRHRHDGGRMAVPALPAQDAAQGQGAVIALGPQAQAVVKLFLKLETQAYPSAPATAWPRFGPRNAGSERRKCNCPSSTAGRPDRRNSPRPLHDHRLRPRRLRRLRPGLPVARTVGSTAGRDEEHMAGPAVPDERAELARWPRNTAGIRTSCATRTRPRSVGGTGWRRPRWRRATPRRT